MGRFAQRHSRRAVAPVADHRRDALGEAADVGFIHAIAEGASGRADVIDRALEGAREALGMDVAYISDTSRGRQEYLRIVGDGDSFGARRGEAVPLNDSYSARVAAGTLPGVIRDARSDPVTACLPVADGASIGAYVGVPLELVDGRTVGMLCCLSHVAQPTLGDRDVDFMRLLGWLIAEHIDREQLLAQNRRLAVAAANVQTLVTALEARDGYTGAHSAAVVELALRVGRQLQLGPEEMRDLESVALLHDVGKIGIPDAILGKSGGLDRQEWALMLRHPLIGADYVEATDGLAALAPAIRAEHERWDGRGYPYGLAGDEIPAVSRIVFVCDAYHAMTSDRPYRGALSVETARAEVARNAGTQFCPTTVAAFLACDLASDLAADDVAAWSSNKSGR